MFCLPACQACRAAGSCPRGQEPAVPLPRQTVTRKPARSAARRAVVDKALSGSFRLACGHWTNRQTQEIYAFARPKGRGLRRKYYCEAPNCSEWVELALKPKIKREDTGDPLF